MRTAHVLVALLLLLVGSAPARAQADLGGTIDSLAGLWARGDAAGVALLISSSGLSLELDGTAVGPLPARQAAAALRRMFEQNQTVTIRAALLEQVAGDEERAFGELTWSMLPFGATVPLEARIFLAFVREDGAWRVTQIRILP